MIRHPQHVRARCLVLALAIGLAVGQPTRSATMNATQSIRELQHDMAAGRLSAESLVRQYLKRIRALNQRGPALHAIISINPDAIAQARALDQERRAHGP